MDSSRGDTVKFLAAVLAVALSTVVLGLLFAPVPARAYTTPPPFSMGYGSATADGLDSTGGSFGSASFEISGAGAADGTYSASTYWTAQTIGGLGMDALWASGVFDGGLSDIIAGALDAAGLYVDFNTHEVYTSNPNSSQYRQYAGCSQATVSCYVVSWEDSLPYNGIVPGAMGFTSSADAIAYMESVEPAAFNLFFGPSSQNCGKSGGTDGGPVVVANGTEVDTHGTCNGANVSQVVGSWSISSGAAAPPPPQNQPQAATPQQIAQALAQQDPGIAPELVNNAQGQEFNTPNVQQAASQLASQIQTQTGQAPANPDPAPTSSTALDNPAPASSTSGPSANLPAFCSWAGVVCDFITWMETKPQPPPPVQLPVNPAPASSSWSSGLGGGACPAPYTFSFNNQTFAIDLTPMCNLMTDIRYLVLAACALIAAFIVSGSARSTV